MASLFGNNTQAQQPAQGGGGLFGNNTNLTANKPAGTGLFTTPVNTQQPQQTATQGTGLFGGTQPTQPTQQPQASLFGVGGQSQMNKPLGTLPLTGLQQPGLQQQPIQQQQQSAVFGGINQPQQQVYQPLFQVQTYSKQIDWQQDPKYNLPLQNQYRNIRISNFPMNNQNIQNIKKQIQQTNQQIYLLQNDLRGTKQIEKQRDSLLQKLSKYRNNFHDFNYKLKDIQLQLKKTEQELKDIDNELQFYEQIKDNSFQYFSNCLRNFNEVPAVKIPSPYVNDINQKFMKRLESLYSQIIEIEEMLKVDLNHMQDEEELEQVLSIIESLYQYFNRVAYQIYVVHNHFSAIREKIIHQKQNMGQLDYENRISKMRDEEISKQNFIQNTLGKISELFEKDKLKFIIKPEDEVSMTKTKQ